MCMRMRYADIYVYTSWQNAHDVDPSRHFSICGQKSICALLSFNILERVPTERDFCFFGSSLIILYLLQFFIDAWFTHKYTLPRSL